MSGTDSGTASGTSAGAPAGASGTPAGAAASAAGSAGTAQDGPPRRRGRPAGTRSGDAAGTRERILAAAREEFSARGYDRTSVRSIGKAAGVDAALVHHYFGTKEQVFAAAVEVSFGPALELPGAMAAGGPDGMGERLARFMLGVWENPVTRGPLLAIIRSAVTNERAAAVFRGLISRKVLARVAGELRVADPEFRVQLAAAQLVGIIMLRYVVKVEPIASAAAEDLVAVVAPTLQRYLTDPDVRPGAAGA
ncbi:TetR/AcrR family transcriptional regulator [Streptomyces sp. IBSBF 2435]|uniref:TetR/AcrR family transcriptional regulator n=1 Tax=Streptomyces sp. IBSBF 2435 TaxID=2903531 RepID=UPI002FDC3F3B